MQIDFWELLATDHNIVLNNQENTTSAGGGHIGNYIVQTMSSADRQLITGLINLIKNQQKTYDERLVRMEKKLDFLKEVILNNRPD